MKSLDSESYIMLLLYFIILFISLVLIVKTINSIFKKVLKLIKFKYRPYETLRELDLEA